MGDDQADRSLEQPLRMIAHLEAGERARVLLEIWEAKRAKEALPYVEQLITLFDLDHEFYFGLRELEWVLLQMRPEIVSILGDLKNKGGDTGRRALQALAGVQEWHNIDAADQAAIRMIIQDRFGHQHRMTKTLLDGIDWMAVRTEDHDALIEALGFGDSMPVTKRFGEFHIVRNVPSDTIYLSPGFDGWLLVFGYYFPPCARDIAPESLAPFLCELSRRFGSAHWYHMDLEDGPRTAWAMAERGELIRYYNNGTGASPGDSQQIGPPHPAEIPIAPAEIAPGWTRLGVRPHRVQQLTLPYPDPFDVYLFCNAYQVARHASVEWARAQYDSEGVAPYTHISGYARIAVRPGARLPLGAFVY